MNDTTDKADKPTFPMNGSSRDTCHYVSGNRTVTGAILTDAWFSCRECLEIKPASNFGLSLRDTEGVIRNRHLCVPCRSE